MENEFFSKIDYEILDEKVAYKGKRITVEELHYKNPRTGDILYREHVLAGKAAIIMPLTNDNKLIMIKEPRTPIGINVLAFPAGMVENGETPEDAALRGLEEETGYKAGKIKKIREEYTAIGYSNERIAIFLATDLVKTQRNLDETEDIEVVTIPLEEAKKLLAEGYIRTSSETIALMHYFLYEENKQNKANTTTNSMAG